ncbi:MAG: ATP-binding cassette domain-containing protein [Planctomycetota bacterium]
MIEFRSVQKTFTGPNGESIHAVRDLDLTIEAGEVHCLIGTSGCGKTTTLRLINRLEEPTAGEVRVGGKDAAELDVIQLRRSVGYVIQSGGLFPHWTVKRNIGVLCELEGWDRDRQEGRVADLGEVVGLPIGQFGDRYPAELSGGQRQRVGVARALALDPDYLLMDEPFGALDPITRSQIHREFQALFRSVGKTVVLVTHDLNEAFLLSDRISVMDRGEVVQTGSADELRSKPANEFIAEFVRNQTPEALR